MRTLFTVHAGEFLVGSEIERRLRRANVWVPTKDTGVDLLVTNSRADRVVSLQIKYSRDYSMLHEGLLVSGWWTLDREKLLGSKADLWVFVLLPASERQALEQYVIIPPRELARRLTRIHGRAKRIQSYLWVTRRGRCWEGRGLTRAQEALIAVDRYTSPQRDLTGYLNAWSKLTERLK
jgi:hypothetical protein